MESYLAPPTSEEQEALDYIHSHITGKLHEDDKHFILDHRTYLLFLRQKDGKKDKALKAIEECIAWRRETKPYAISYQEVEPWASVGVAFVRGVTKKGVPVVHVQPKSGLPVDVDLRVKHSQWMMEELMRRGYRECVFVGDFSMIDAAPTSEEKKVREKMDDVRSRYYPLFETKLFFVSMPLVLRAIFAVMTALMSGAQKETMVTGLKPKHLKEWIAESELLERLGGELKILQTADGKVDVIGMMPPPRTA